MNILIKIISSFFLLTILASNISANDSIKVLILNSWSPDHNWVKGEVKGIKDALQRRHQKIEFTTEYIDYPRIQGVNKEKYIQSYHQFFNNKYKNQKVNFDIIFVTDDPALTYMLKYHDKYFPDTPVVFCGINNYSLKNKLEKKDLFLGILENVDYLGTFSIAKKLHPQAKKFYILGDQTNTSQSQIKEIKKISSIFSVEFEYLDNLSFKQLSEKLNTLTRNDIVFLAAFYSDSEGKQITPQESIDFIKRNTKAPIYSFWKWMMEKGGILGGKVLSSYDHGKEAVEKFYMIDKKEKFLVKGGSNPYIFDYNQLKRFDIDIKKLPVNTQVINKPFSFYETYKLLVNGTIFFIVLLLILLSMLLLNIKKRKITELNLKNSRKELEILNKELDNKIADRTEELEHSNDELEQTITNLKLTQNKLVESEKMSSLGVLVAGVAHEINTPIGIGLTGATHFLSITNKIKKDYEEERMSQKEFENYIDTSKEIAILINTNLSRTAQLVTNFKKISFDQSSEEKRKINLRKYLDDILLSMNSITKKTNIVIENKCPNEININTYPGAISQIITNLIINSIKHAFKENEKGNIIINVTMKDDRIELVYEDTGRGIDKDTLPKIFDPFFTTNRVGGGTGLGLNILYNIISNTLSGTVKCSSEKGHGIKFTIVFQESKDIEKDKV